MTDSSIARTTERFRGRNIPATTGGILAIGGLAACLAAVVGEGTWTDGLQWSLFMLASASLAAIIGLIFGVPRSRADYRPEATERFESNSNLEQISDWLTKLLVGAGLIELTKFPGALSDLGDYLGTGMKVSNPAAFATTAVVYGVGVGFGGGYLWTRLRLRVLLEQSERAATEASKKDEIVGQLQTQSDPGPVSDLVRAATRAIARTAAMPTQERLPILWVDDVPGNNEGIVAALRALDIEVEQVLSTSEALERVRRKDYSVIISDVGRLEGDEYKEMAGRDLLLALGNEPIATPVLIFAGPRGVQRADELSQAGARLVTQRASEVFSEAVRYVTGGAP